MKVFIKYRLRCLSMPKQKQDLLGAVPPGTLSVIIFRFFYGGKLTLS